MFLIKYIFLGKIIRGTDIGKLIVVKKWKKFHVQNVNFWNNDILCYNTALYFVNQWNLLNIINKKYILSKAWISKCVQSANTNLYLNKICKTEWVLCEYYLSGKFTKFNSNSGYINKKYKNNSIQAFSHWTYHFSKGKYLMCDIQGIRNKTNYIITDPCICSLNKGTYGVTDIGFKGIIAFFNNHKCNEFCEKVWIKPVFNKKYFLNSTEKSLYHWNV